MTIASGDAGATVPPGPVPVSPISAEERIALLRQPPPRFSRRGLLLLAAAAALLGGGGVAAEVALSARGINGPPSTAAADSHRVVQPSQAPTLPAFLGLSALGGKAAPQFRLLDAAGKVVSLGQLRGRGVVLSFFDASCTSLCPVVAAELKRLAADLGPEASRVDLLSVNTSPLDTSPADARRAAKASGLGTLANWQFLTAPLASLDPLWSAYGVTVELQKSTGVLSYTGTGYLISPSGRLEYSFTPFGNESRSGTDSLPAATSARFASALARYVKAMLP